MRTCYFPLDSRVVFLSSVLSSLDLVADGDEPVAVISEVSLFFGYLMSNTFDFRTVNSVRS